MKLTILLLLLTLILLTGCTETRQADADRTRAATRRTNELHAQRLSDNEATEDTRRMTKTILLWAGAIGGAVIILAGSVAGSWALIGFSLSWVRQRTNVQQIALAESTRQYPLIIYRNQRAYNPNTGQILRLDNSTGPHMSLTAISGQAIVSGVNSPKMIEVSNGKT